VARDTQVLPIYEFTAQLASLAPPTSEEQQVFGAVACLTIWMRSM
jgi:hypothetical protein